MDNTRPSVGLNPQDLTQAVLELMQGGDPDLISIRYGISRAELQKRLESYQASRRQQALAEHLTMEKVGRNEPCPCGSGKKYKKCCLPMHEEARKIMPADQLQKLEELTKLREKHEKDIQKAFDLLFSQDFEKARHFASQAIESFPEDDRLHDILVSTALARGDYETAFHTCEDRWQIADEEKAFLEEHGHHKRGGADAGHLTHFFPPSTWLEKIWISQRALTYSKIFPPQGDAGVQGLVEKLKQANDTKRFPIRQGEGYQMRKQALAPVLSQLQQAGARAVPYLLPLTYTFSWASLFVPGLLRSYGTDECVKLLAELSMFRFPYFSQECLIHLEEIGEPVVPRIKEVLEEGPTFDELKVGIITVLGSIRTHESFALLAGLTEHENPYVVSCVAQALGRQQNPDALPYLQKAQERMGALSKIAGVMKELGGERGE